MLFQPRKRPRKFSYTPFYLKEKNGKENSTRRIKFKRTRKPKTKKGIPIVIILLAILVYLLISYLNRISQ